METSVQSRHEGSEAAPQSIYARPDGGVYWALKKRTVDPGRPLPTATRDLDALTADLDTHGYCFIAEALSAADTAEVRARIHEQIAMEEELGLAASRLPNGCKITHNLLNKGAEFQKATLHPIVDALVEHLIGENFILSGVTTIQTVPGSRAQGLHYDQHRFGFPMPVPIVANSVFMLDDFTEENGATRVIPGSHLWDADLVERAFESVTVIREENPPHTLPATGKAGTCFMFDGRLMHAGGRNVSNGTRTGLFGQYFRGWMRSTINPFLSIPDEVMASFPVRLREQLGYRLWNTFGSWGNAGIAPPLDVVRPVNTPGELRRK